MSSITITSAGLPAAGADLLLETLDESPTNPRKGFGDLTELTESIKEKGVLQPILVRPKGNRFEIIAGHRRFRAAKLAGLEVVPAVIKEMTDKEAHEAQLVENCQREDLSPMDEAEAYRVLLEEHQLPVEEIAAKIGRSKPYVYQRLQLLRLTPGNVKALQAGKITLGAAVLLARIADPATQDEAFKNNDGRHDGEADDPITANDIRHWAKFQLHRLAEAPFKPSDAELVPAAGACTVCPKRTGHNADLFGEDGKDNRCTDPVCWGKKVDAVWEIRKVEVKNAGGTVIEKKAEVKKLFPYGEQVVRGAPFVELDHQAWEDPKRRTWRKLLGDAVKVTLVRSPEGKIVELAAKAGLAAAMKERGHTWFERRNGRGSSTTASAGEKKRRETAKIQAAVAREVLDAIAAKGGLRFVNQDLDEVTLWKALARAAVRSAWHDSARDVAARRGLKKTGKGWRPEDVLMEELADASASACFGLVLELLAHRDVSHDSHGAKRDGTSTGDFCELLGIDRAAIAKRVTVELKERASLKAVKKPVAGKASAQAPKAAAAKKTSKKPARKRAGKKR
jgi:ParB/RepB/Spo0J family partition protein